MTNRLSRNNEYTSKNEFTLNPDIQQANLERLAQKEHVQLQMGKAALFNFDVFEANPAKQESVQSGPEEFSEQSEKLNSTRERAATDIHGPDFIIPHQKDFV